MKRDYSDIIHLNRPVSEKHPPMDSMMRAAQFAPFAALTGHDEAVRETARLTEEEIELDEYEIAELDRKLQYLKEHSGVEATVTHFVKDARKNGGVYVRDTGIVKKIDEYTHTLVLLCEGNEAPPDVKNAAPPDTGNASNMDAPNADHAQLLIDISKIIEILI